MVREKQRFIKDLNATLNLLNVAIEGYEKDINSRNPLSQFYEDFTREPKKRLSIAIQCKENVEFVKDVVENLTEIPDDVNTNEYHPRKINRSEIGKYREEMLIIKKRFEPALAMSKLGGYELSTDECKDCIMRLNYLYSNLPKLNM